MKAVVLLSGGLDSRLALKWTLERGFEALALNFVTVFCTCTTKGRSCSEALSACRSLGVPLKVANGTQDLIDAVKKPRFGYGSGMNPCLDCRILVFRKARKFMEEIGASFLVTGEVLGERPMSQRREAIETIERESGCDGLVVRPLSGALFPPTLPEQKGWIRRVDLFSIGGRSRKPQIELAKDYNIHDYPCPAGGCLLTQKEFAEKVRDLLNHGELNVRNAMRLKIGRHFRIGSGSKLIVGRDERENLLLEQLALASGERFIRTLSVPGPAALLSPVPHRGDDGLETALKIVARYGDGVTPSCGEQSRTTDRVAFSIRMDGKEELKEAAPFLPRELDDYRVC